MAERTHLAERQAHDARQALAAVGRVGAQGGPPPVHERLVGVLEAGRRRHAVVRTPDAALLVADLVQGREDFRGESSRLFENLFDHVEGGVREPRQVSVSVQREHVAQNEAVLAQGRLVGHETSPDPVLVRARFVQAVDPRANELVILLGAGQQVWA
jgi:hypothetical protein